MRGMSLKEAFEPWDSAYPHNLREVWAHMLNLCPRRVPLLAQDLVPDMSPTMSDVLIQLCILFVSLTRENGSWWQRLHISVRGMHRWQLFPGWLVEICCNEVIQVLLNDTIVILTRSVANCGIPLNVNYRVTNPEWLCSVVLMIWASQVPTFAI